MHPRLLIPLAGVLIIGILIVMILDSRQKDEAPTLPIHQSATTRNLPTSAGEASQYTLEGDHIRWQQNALNAFDVPSSINLHFRVLGMYGNAPPPHLRTRY